MYHGPLRSTTCSTRPTRSPPPPFLSSLARTPACLPTDRRHSPLPSSSHLSPDVFHSLASLSLTFSFSLAPTRACPPIDRHNDATTASLLAPPTCWTRCRSRSRCRSPLRGRVRRPTIRTTQRRRRYSRLRRPGLAVAHVLALARPYADMSADRTS